MEPGYRSIIVPNRFFTMSSRRIRRQNSIEEERKIRWFGEKVKQQYTRSLEARKGRKKSWGSFPAGNEPSRNPHSAWTREIFILMVDITRILVTVETLRVRNSGRYHAPCGIYDIKGESRAQVFEIGEPEWTGGKGGGESTFLTYRPRVYLSNTNFRRLTHKKGVRPFSVFRYDHPLRNFRADAYFSIDRTRFTGITWG